MNKTVVGHIKPEPIFVGLVVDQDGTPRISGWSKSKESFGHLLHETMVELDRTRRTERVPHEDNPNSFEIREFIAVSGYQEE